MKKVPGVAAKIVELRTLRRETQEQFAKRVGVYQGTISLWESGDLNPGVGPYLKFAQLANTVSSELAQWFWQQIGVSPPEPVELESSRPENPEPLPEMSIEDWLKEKEADKRQDKPTADEG
jgi:transcriptional regulator with XRE-family HTH domain